MDRKFELIKQKRLLVIDNEPDNLNVIKRFAEKRDFKVTIINDFDHAMFSLSIGLFDVALIDLHFNGENSGLELIKKIPKNEKPIAIMSTVESPAAVKQAINLGVYYWFDKPLNLEFLMEKLTEFAYLVPPSKLNELLDIINKKD